MAKKLTKKDMKVINFIGSTITWFILVSSSVVVGYLVYRLMQWLVG